MEPALSTSATPEVNRSWASVFLLSHENFFLFCCVLFAFFLRLILISRASVIYWDGTYYANLGMKMISGDLSGGISAYWSPLYSFLVGISSLFFQDSEFAGRVISLIAGTLLVVPAYFLIRDFYGRVPAYIGIILIVIHPMLIRSSVWVMTESLYTLVFTTIVLIGWHTLRSGKAQGFFFTGLLFGVAYLLKPEAIGFVGLFFVLALGGKFFCPNLNFRGLLAGYALLLVGFSIFLLPYVVLIHQKTGRWTISQKLLNNVSSVDYEKGELELTDNGQMTRKDELFNDIYEAENSQTNPSVLAISSPTSAPRMTSITGIVRTVFFNLKKEITQYIPETFPFIYPFILLAIIGFFYKPWTRLRTAKEIYLFFFFFSTLVGYAATAIQVRYLIPLIPILICWISHGIVGFSDWAVKSVSRFFRANRKLNPIFTQVFSLLALVTFLLLSYPVQMSLEKAENLPLEEKRAGLWIKTQANSQSLIMAASPIPAFYAGTKHTYLPDEEFSAVLEYAKRKKVNYLVFGKRRLNDTPSAFPTDEQNLPRELRLVYQDEQNPEYKIVVYEISN